MGGDRHKRYHTESKSHSRSKHQKGKDRKHDSNQNDKKDKDSTKEKSNRRSRSRDRDRDRNRSRSKDRKRDNRSYQNEKYDKQIRNQEHNEQNRGLRDRLIEEEKKGQDPAQQLLENKEEEPERKQPDFQPSGILAQFSNSVNGVIIKFNEDQEAIEPEDKWRLFVYKGKDSLGSYPLYGMKGQDNQKSHLIGKNPNMCDLILDHPSVSGQHAVIQFRFKQGANQIFPYLMDLQSTNGTFLEGDKVEDSRYIQLRHKDMLKFGNSTREYLLIKEADAKVITSESEQEIVEEKQKEKLPQFESDSYSDALSANGQLD